jgi:hypothetical protein
MLGLGPADGHTASTKESSASCCGMSVFAALIRRRQRGCAATVCLARGTILRWHHASSALFRRCGPKVHRDSESALVAHGGGVFNALSGEINAVAKQICRGQYGPVGPVQARPRVRSS